MRAKLDLMAISLKMRKLVLARDGHCLHCGIDDETLVLNHRINRGMGSSKLLDGPENLVTVCSRWNGEMEATSASAIDARKFGHKLSAWEATNRPVFDCSTLRWWTLFPDGSRLEFHIGNSL